MEKDKAARDRQIIDQWSAAARHCESMYDVGAFVSRIRDAYYFVGMKDVDVDKFLAEAWEKYVLARDRCYDKKQYPD